MDYKTNKEIKTEGFKNYEGITQKMLFPLNHLDDCNLNHYTLQLSLYMYIILKHNPRLSAGKLTLQHVVFEEEFDKDPYGYPLYYKRAQKIGIPEAGVNKILNAKSKALTNAARLKDKLSGAADFNSVNYDRVVLDDYIVTDLALGYQFWDFLSIKSRIENIFNEQYEEILYYGTLGRSLYFGLDLNF